MDLLITFGICFIFGLGLGVLIYLVPYYLRGGRIKKRKKRNTFKNGDHVMILNRPGMSGVVVWDESNGDTHYEVQIDGGIPIAGQTLPITLFFHTYNLKKVD